MKLFNHFDILAPYYDRFIRSNDPERFLKLCHLPASGRMLDAGGGTGRKSQPLSKFVDEIIIADSSFGMLSQARGKEGLIPVGSETEHLPFCDESFSRVIMVDAFHHIADYPATVEELWRVLQPGGWIVIEEPDIRFFPVKIIAAIEKMALMRSHFISPQKIANAFSYSNAEANVKIDNGTAWIIIYKRQI
jgi:ubiquinone/menaquinone biosynthesis C-methylase UbiE